MKKKLILLIALILCLSVMLASCDLLAGLLTPPAHTHNYVWVDNKDGTHVQHCQNTGCDKPDINSGNHDWSASDTCVCGAKKPVVSTHEHDYVWIDNGDGTHVQLCVKLDCDNPTVNKAPHEWNETDTCVCNAIKPTDDSHVHNYDWVIEEDTHVMACTNDGCYQPYINLGDHVYNVIDSGAATCKEAGYKSYKCPICKDDKLKVTDKLDHESSGFVYFDPDNDWLGHWEICKYCGEEVMNKDAHSMEVIKHVDATCVDYAKDVYKCKGCAYSYTEEDDSVPLTGHTFQAYVCINCQQDLMLDYADYFAAHGVNYRDPVIVDSEQELILYIDYLYFSGVYGGEDAENPENYRFIDITYANADGTTDEGQQLLVQALYRAMDGKTAGSFASFSVGFIPTIPYIAFVILDNPSTVASVTPTEDGYGEELYPQYYSPAFDMFESNRADDFDDFKYLDRTRQVSVSTSDQLFFAFEHGYEPIPVVGSVAERMLNKAKVVARNIMDDTMTEVEKLAAIYLWLVEDIAYDYGALHNAKNDWNLYTAYYLEGVFDYGAAVCDGISKAYCVLAGIENITCVRVTGEIKNGGGGHAWNKVFVDADGDGEKEWYVSDATWGNTLFNGNLEMLNLKFFLTTDAEREGEMSALYNYIDTDCDATTTVNPFEYFYYDGNTANYDFVIENRAEFTAILTFVAELIKQNSDIDVCFNVYIPESYCSTSAAFLSELQAAMQAAHLPGTMKYNFELLELDEQVGHTATLYFNTAA